MGFDISECADNPYNAWIGAQIRADLYGWVCPGNPDLAFQLVTQDASLSHRTEGIYGAQWVAVLAALLAGSAPLPDAIDTATSFIPTDSQCAIVVQRAKDLQNDPKGANVIRDSFGDMSPVHTVNNLGLVAWSLLRNKDDFDAAIGDVVEAGLDTDCNGATVGALWGLQGKSIPAHWIEPWDNRVGVSLAGQSELKLDSLVSRTVVVANQLNNG